MITNNPALLTADHIPTYLALRTDGPTMKAASAVLQGLERLSEALTADDLLRHAVAHGEEPVRVLADLAESLDAALGVFLKERKAAGELLRTDRLERHALDVAALELRGYAEADLQHHQRQAVAVQANAGRELERMRAAGLENHEIDAIQGARKGRPDPQVTAHQQAAQACADRMAAIDAFLADRLRDTGKLGDALLVEVRERAAAIPLRAQTTTGEDVERRAKAVKDNAARNRLIARLIGSGDDAEPAQG